MALSRNYCSYEEDEKDGGRIRGSHMGYDAMFFFSPHALPSPDFCLVHGVVHAPKGTPNLIRNFKIVRGQIKIHNNLEFWQGQCCGRGGVTVQYDTDSLSQKENEGISIIFSKLQ